MNKTRAIEAVIIFFAAEALGVYRANKRAKVVVASLERKIEQVTMERDLLIYAVTNRDLPPEELNNAINERIRFMNIATQY